MSTISRRHAREWALQLLFQIDANPVKDLAPVISDFWIQQLRLKQDMEDDVNAVVSQEPIAGVDVRPLAPDAAAELLSPKRFRIFAEQLVRGVMDHLDAIDGRLSKYTDNWPLHRMGGVDRNVLRLAMFEMFFDDQTPPVVVINEAVDLAKFFSSSESGRFVNGILDRACKEVTRPPREPGKTQAANQHRRFRTNKAAPGMDGKA